MGKKLYLYFIKGIYEIYIDVIINKCYKINIKFFIRRWYDIDFSRWYDFWWVLYKKNSRTYRDN